MVGGGAEVATNVPEQACRVFGSEVPPGQFRPRDADGTGGYYQPLLIELADRRSIAAQRITCPPANVPLAVALQWREEYAPNQNPRTAVLMVNGVTTPSVVASEAEVELRLEWSAEDAEAYVAVDPRTGELASRREAIRVSWYADAGELAHERSGVEEDQAGQQASNRWRAPTAGAARLWAVVRDSRGGVQVLEQVVQVAP